MNLVIDIGNTRSKLAIFKDCQMVTLKIEETINLKVLETLISEFPLIEQCIISSVSQIKDEIIAYISDRKFPLILLDAETLVPFTNNYSTKETLGRDRIAAIAGACKLFPGKNALVIDAGTAITFDMKDQHEKYLGGNISPGLEMRFKALHHFTANLPLLKSKISASFIGDSTNEAIINGVQNGIIFEMQGYIDSLQLKYPDLLVILTGGDSAFFENKVKRTIFVNSNLILSGLNTILEYNA
jgi:type III pantothenate kinase